MKTTAIKSLALCSGLLMAIVSLGGTCFAQSQEQEQQPMSTTQVSASESGPEAAQTVESNPALSVGNSQRQAGEFTESRLGLSLLKNIVLDQKAIWTSPAHLRLDDAKWLIPFAGITAASLAADANISKALTPSTTWVGRSNTFSNYGIAALGGVTGGLYLLGKMTDDEHKRETGVLSGEAAVDAVGATTALQYAIGRQRPSGNFPASDTDANGGGGFWQHGTSFPSDHATAAWAVASVIAHEYPGPLTKLFVYGLASAVSVSRVTGEDHFPTDVLVGSAIGWFIGQHVYRAHHDPRLGGGSWETFSEAEKAEPDRSSGSNGSPYVPLDSWVYPAFERLAALGYVQTELLGLRPWTRSECARLLGEANDLIRAQEPGSDEPGLLYRTLESEFQQEMGLSGDESDRSLRLESVYTQATEISGAPLRDGYHFGQTTINDFGRPYAEGTNLLSGFSGWASLSRIAIYVRGEYQHAPSAPAYSQDTRNLIAQLDSNPVQPAEPSPTVNQFDLLDAYALVNIDNYELSFGKESLWWGPGQSGPLIWSDNAEPVLMGRASRTVSSKLPGFLGFLGPMRMDMFFGKLAGHEFLPRPLIHGENISFKPTPRLEMGVSRVVIFSGVGYPLTLKRLRLSYFDLYGHPTPYTAANDPGDRRVSFDFSYRLTNSLTVYSNFYWDDAIRRTAFNPGIYLPRIPRLPKLDLRAEYVSTDVPPDSGQHTEGKLIYYNALYHDGYVNGGNLIGNWVGRQGHGAQFWGTYWLSPRSSVQVAYRHGWINPNFIPQGGALTDVSARADLWVRSDLDVSASTQYELWNVPELSPSSQRDVATSIQLTFHPKWSK